MIIKATKVFRECWQAIHERVKVAKVVNGRTKIVQERKYRIIEQVGGSRSSKTYSDFQIIYLYALQNPMISVTVMRDTAVDCRDKVETEFKQWLKDPNGRAGELAAGEITISQYDDYIQKERLDGNLIQNKSLHTWTFENGSHITFTGTDDEDRSIGKSQNVLWVNEPYKFSEEVFTQLTQRTSDFVIVDWNPKQDHFIEKLRLRENTFVHKSTLLDNPFCPVESKRQILSYQPLKRSKVVESKIMTLKEAMAYDCITNPKGLDNDLLSELRRCIRNEKQKTASDYHYSVYFLGEKAEKPNRIYKDWEAITLKEFEAMPYNVYHGLDFGHSNPTALLAVKYDGDRTFYVKPIMYKPINGMAMGLSWTLDAIGIEKRIPLIVDPADREERLALVRNGFNVILAYKGGTGNVVSGISTVSRFNIKYVKDIDFESEYENYEWEVVNGVNLDRPYKDKDHYLDALRYVITWLCKYLNIK